MKWQDYSVTILRPNGVTLTNIRGISERDVRYVATTPCKRNSGRPKCGPLDSILTIERTA
jgi:hypothetical protein